MPDSLETLQQAFATAKSPVNLNADFITNGGVTAPADFDKNLIAAFALGSATGLSLAYSASDVGAVQNNAFTITNATLPDGFLKAAESDTSVTLTFTLPVGNDAVLQVDITNVLSNWQFSTGFPAMIGHPFDQLQFSSTSFIFSTANPASFTAPVTADPTYMTFSGGMQLSLFTQSLLAICNLVGGNVVPNPPIMKGPISLSVVDNDKVLYPIMELQAPITISSTLFQILIFSASNAFIGFSVTEPQAAGDGSDDGDKKTKAVALATVDDSTEQKMLYTFGATATAGTLSLDLGVELQSGGDFLALQLSPDTGSDTITPEAIASLVGVPSTFMGLVPAPLQNFLSNIAFKNLSLAGTLDQNSNTATMSSITVLVGTTAPISFTFLNDLTSGLDLTVKTLDLTWSVLNPSDGAKAQQGVSLSTSFTIFPKIFTNADGTDGGEFDVTIDQNYVISASFNGQVTLANLLSKVSAGLIQMPSGIKVTFNDISFQVDPPAHSYSFSLGVDASVDIITWNSKPLIQLEGVLMSLSAATATKDSGGDGKTTYTASIAGTLCVGPVGVNATIAYDGAADPSPVWTLQTDLAAPVDLGLLLTELFGVVDLANYLPDFLSKDLLLNSFSVNATIPTANGAFAQYQIDASLEWGFTLPGLGDIKCEATLGLAHDASKPADEQFSGSVIGTIDVPAIDGLAVTIGYAFNQPGSTGGSTLFVTWEGITATYDRGSAGPPVVNPTITVTLSGWSFGKLLTSLMKIIGEPYFTLDSPWDFLNSISLDGLSVVFDLTDHTTTAEYTLSSPIELGFITINGIQLKRNKDTKKYMLSIDGSSVLTENASVGDDWKPLFDPSQGSDVKQMPSVPGQGNALFDLHLLALGQHVTIGEDFTSIADVITSLESLPSTLSGAGSANPIDPGSGTKGQPYYSAASGWLVAIDLDLLGTKQGDGYIYAIKAKVVFNDPTLYGLRLELDGDKVKVLSGLSIDIMYKKVSEGIGLYQIDFSLPTALRQITMGEVNITLPSIGIEVYTNGDFLFDFGFPYHLDFSQSFTLQVLIGPIPAMGSGGFYFGKLSNATATMLPKTSNGTFDPVIVFGVGLQAGLGYSIDKGIFSAGFSITIFGIIEGVIAPYHPYPGFPVPGDGPLEGKYYFWIQGQFGLIGKLYGTINFAIISATVSLEVQFVLQITFEAFRAIPMSVSASVSVSVSVKIDLGIFSFHIHFSFSTTISESMTIGQNSTAPWDPVDKHAALLGPERRSGRPEALMALRARLPRPRFRSLAIAMPEVVGQDVMPTLTIALSAQFTVLSPDVTNMSLSTQEGAFVALLAMDAPNAADSGKTTGSSFESLCTLMLPWVIDGHLQLDTPLSNVLVTAKQVQQIINTLACPEHQPTIAAKDFLDFLNTHFTVNIVPAPALTTAQQTALQNGAAIFPVVPGLSLTVPNWQTPTQTVTIPFDQWATVTGTYRTTLIDMFNKVAASVGETKPPPVTLATDPGPESLAKFMLEDYAALVARQLLQAALDAYDSFPYALQVNDSLQTIMNFAQGGSTNNPHFTFTDLVNANLTVPLTAGNTLTFAAPILVSQPVAFKPPLPPVLGIRYTVQAKDTLTAIAGLYSDSSATPPYATTEAGIITINAAATNLLAPNVGIGSHTTVPGDSFNSVAKALGIPLPTLAAMSSLYGMNNLLLPAASMIIPPISYTTSTAGTDQLGALLQKFNITAGNFVGADSTLTSNLTVQNLFDLKQQPLVMLSNLEQLTPDQLAQAVAAGKAIAQTAGMVSRFMMHGLRLPNMAGLALPSGFLYPTNQPDYGFYQLTGQQFRVPAAFGSSYGISLTKDSTLSWLQLNGNTSTQSVPLDLTAAAANLTLVVNYAHSPGYDPSAVQPAMTLAAEDPVSLMPQQYPAASFSKWATSGLSEVATVTGDTSVTGQSQPILWSLPDALISQIEKQQAALAPHYSLHDMLQYLPVLEPAVLTTDPATQSPTATELDAYAFATRIDFQIKLLSQSAGAKAQTPFSNTVVPAGQGNAPPPTQLAPYSFQLIGPDPSDAVLLERLLIQMESLGCNVVSGLFLLFTAPGTGNSGLVGHASSEVYSFVTRSNLSTESNPPPSSMALMVEMAQACAPINNTANGPEEFIRLLWELSTVRSGGYNFYYQGLAAGTDLPPGLFDSTGTATLTLVITYARSTGLNTSGSRVTNCVNAVVSLDPIDTGRSTLALVSQSAPATVTPLATDTLSGLAAIYGMTPGTLAVDNPNAPLTVSTQIPIVGVYHEVTQADINSGNIFATVAAYYSVGAATQITAQALMAYNNNITPALYSLLLIPPTTYVVGQIGTTIGNIASRLGLRNETLGYLAADIAGLFQTNPVITITVDSQSYSAVSALGLSNAGIELTRANFGSDQDSTDPNYGRDYMYSLYSLLDMSFMPNAFYKAAPFSAPFGPAQSGPPNQTTESTKKKAAKKNPTKLQAAHAAHIKALRDPRMRSQMLAEQADAPLDYKQVLSVANSAQINPAPAAPATGLPPASNNPYIGVGTVAQFQLRWLDLFGNRTITPFDTPPANYSGPLNGQPAPVGYTDSLVGLARWPNVSSSYIYAGAPSAPELDITFALNPAAYQLVDGQPAKAAADDLKVFTLIYYQLNQNYDGLNVPGLSGPAVSMLLKNTLVGDIPQPLDSGPIGQIIQFVNACLIYVQNAAAGNVANTAPTTTLQLPLAMSSVVTDNIVELQLAFILKRATGLIDPALLDTAGGVSVVTTIPPQVTTGPSQDVKHTDAAPADAPPADALLAFAKAAEKVFDTSTWQFNIGAGAADPAEARGNQTFTVWAVRRSVGQSTTGLSFDLGTSPVYYAPKPVAKSLYTGTIAPPLYKTGAAYPAGNGASSTFTAADLNLWTSQALTAIDSFLSPTYAAPTFILDELLGNDGDTDGYLANILKQKSDLAETISGTLNAVLPATTDATKAAATEVMKQALLSQLGNAYSVAAVVALPVTAATTNEPLEPGTSLPPSFYGQPSGDVTQNTDNQNYALSTAKIPLNDSTATDHNSTLAFLFSCSNISEQAYVPLNLTYKLTHLEHGITEVPGITGYRQSQWIRFVTGPYPIVIGCNKIPVVLRALPQPPIATAQQAKIWWTDSGNSGTPTPAELPDWDYSFTYTSQRAAQDILQATVSFNKMDDNSNVKSEDSTPTDDLFAALVPFVTAYPAISRDLDAYLRLVDGKTEKTSTTAISAKFAVDAFSQIVTSLAAAYKAWANPPHKQAMAMLSTGPQPTIMTIQVGLDSGPDSEAVINVMQTSLDGPSPGLPVVQIDPANYTAEPYTPANKPPNWIVSYRYYQMVDKQKVYLTHDAALAIQAQTIVFDQLNAFAFQSATTTIQIVRNEELIPAGPQTNEVFWLTTPEVKYANPVVPLLVYDSYDMSALAPSPSPLGSYLGPFLQQMLGGVPGDWLTVQIETTASYPIAPKIDATAYTDLPVNMLPPTVATASSGPPNFVAPLATCGMQWLTPNKASLGGIGATMSFNVTVYGGLTATPWPLVKIKDLSIPVDAVSV